MNGEGNEGGAGMATRKMNRLRLRLSEDAVPLLIVAVALMLALVGAYALLTFIQELAA